VKAVEVQGYDVPK